MAVDFRREEAAEWMDERQATVPRIALPEPNSDYAYAAARLFSWYPVINTRGATYEREDFDEDLLGTLIGKQCNLSHDKSKVVGAIESYDLNGEGLDVCIRLDREQASIHDLDIEAMRLGNYFSHVSVELTKDPSKSFFYAYDSNYNIKNKIPVLAGREGGIRRTTARDAFNLMGNRVAERIKPARFTGVGFTPNPSDKTAELYAVAADDEIDDDILQNMDVLEILEEHFNELVSEETEQAAKDFLTAGTAYADPGWQADGKKRYPLDTEAHVRSAARFFGRAENRSKYGAAHVKAIDAKIATAKKRLGIGETDETASSIPLIRGDHSMSLTADQATELSNKVDRLQAEVNSLTAERETASAAAQSATARIAELETAFANKETELASAQTDLTAAQTELATLRSEKEVAEREVAVNSLVAELEAILPAATDEERNALREIAKQANDDDADDEAKGKPGKKSAAAAKLKRELEKATAEIETLKKPKAPEGETAEAEATRLAKEKELASAQFNVNDDEIQALGERVVPPVEYKGHKTTDLNLLS